MNSLGVGDIVLLVNNNTKDLLCLIISAERIYNIPTEDHFFQYHLFCPESTYKFRVWNSSCKNSSRLEKVN